MDTQIVLIHVPNCMLGNKIYKFETTLPNISPTTTTAKQSFFFPAGVVYLGF